jgi:hypothetical protein
MDNDTKQTPDATTARISQFLERFMADLTQLGVSYHLEEEIDISPKTLYILNARDAVKMAIALRTKGGSPRMLLLQNVTSFTIVFGTTKLRVIFPLEIWKLAQDNS